MTDEIVAEVREIREAYAAKYGYNPTRICRDLRRREKRSAQKAVDLSGGKPRVSSKRK